MSLAKIYVGFRGRLGVKECGRQSGKKEKKNRLYKGLCQGITDKHTIKISLRDDLVAKYLPQVEGCVNFGESYILRNIAHRLA